MNLAITPSPRPEEREALIAGIERLLADPARRVPAQYRSAWRLTGIKEATEAAPTPGARGSERP